MKLININNQTFFIGTIAIIMIFAVLKIAQTITLPLVISVFLSLLLMPVIHILRKKKVPPVLSSILSLSIVFLVLGLIGSILIVPVNELIQKIPFYTARLAYIAGNLAEYLEPFGINSNVDYLLSQIDPKAMAGILGKGMASVFNVFKYSLLIFFITLFLLIESSRIKTKSASVFGTDSIFFSNVARIGKEIQRYLIFKTLISLGTAIFVYVFLSFLGTDFAIVWALITFVFNFVPSVGSIVASLPPILMALVQFDSPLKFAAITTVGLLSIQVTIGNYLDPKIMGENLNISTLIVFLSMVFWGWMWGPIGMLFAVPLTVCMKVILSSSEKTKNIALMMEG